MGKVSEKQVIAGTKREAIRRFVNYLVEGPCGRWVASVVLFGSVARGEATEGSDVDLLVFSVGPLDEVKGACAEAAFRVGLEVGESVQPLVRSVFKRNYACSPLVKVALAEGREVYRMPEEKLRLEARGFLELSKEFLETVDFLLNSGRTRGAADVGFNALELTAKGLLRLSGERAPKTHGGIVNRVGELLIKTGKLPSGRKLGKGLALRNDARYDPFAVVEEKGVRELLDTARLLMETLEMELKEKA